MNLDFIEPITLYQVVPSSQGNGIWKVKEIELSTLQDALDLGRTTCYLPEFGYSKFSYADLFTDEYSALKEAYDRMCYFLISEWNAMKDVSEEEPEEVKEDSHGYCGECDCCKSNCEADSIPLDNLYPLDEYPSKLVWFPSTKTIKLFRRKPGQTPSEKCKFISTALVEAFKKDATNKTDYSLTAAKSPSKYKKWCDQLFA